MSSSHWSAFVLAFACWGPATSPTPAQAPAGPTYLLHVSNGQRPNDTGQDDKTKPELVDHVKELGGKALKVAFAPGDSFGVKGGAVRDWARFARLRLTAVNPADHAVALELTVVHARSAGYQTRVVQALRLKPGKNEVTLALREWTNVNGSAPDLANVTRWYIHDVDGKAPTVFFGDVWLEGGDARPPTPGAAAGGDPARLARIRAARMPAIGRPVLFHTPEADAVLAALEVFPPDNPWNLVIETWPLHPRSPAIVASVGAAKPFRYNPDMGFVLVPPDQKRVDVKIVEYAGESDRGPFPVPENVPIEGWPLGYPGLSLEAVQRKREEGDRHALVVDPARRMLYEFYQMRRTDAGWRAAQASVFDLKSNKLRPDTWTSADAAGLPIFPAVVRYDELQRGLVEHAMRVTVTRTRRAYVYPATHFASSRTDEDLPRMGERFRLRRDFDVTPFSPHVRAILKGLKKYGMFVADNGIDWAISVAPDPRIKPFAEELRKIKGADFEVVTPPPGYQPPSQ